MTTTTGPSTSTAAPSRPRRRLPLSVALTGAVVGLLVAELAVRGLLTVGMLPATPGWMNAEYAVKAETMQELAATGGAGMVVLGSSVADTGIEPTDLRPEVVGQRPGFNAGLLGPTPTIVEQWSRGWVEPLLEPDVAVVVVSSRDVNANAPHLREYEQRFDESLWVRHGLGSESAMEAVERWITERSALVRYRTALRRPVAEMLRYTPPPLSAAGRDTHLDDSDYRIEEVVDALEEPDANPLTAFALDPERLEALRRLSERLVTAGTRVVIVDAPVTIDYAPLHPGGVADYLDYREAIESLARDQGAEWLVPGLWELDHFADPVHVNHVGARRLSALVDAVLAEPPTTAGGAVDLDRLPEAAALTGPPDPGDPAAPGPATLDLHGIRAP